MSAARPATMLRITATASLVLSATLRLGAVDLDVADRRSAALSHDAGLLPVVAVAS